MKREKEDKDAAYKIPLMMVPMNGCVEWVCLMQRDIRTRQLYRL